MIGMGQRIAYARSMVGWAFRSFLPLWLIILPMGAAFITIGAFGASEPSFRITGMVFQVIGLVPIFLSVLSLRREFGYPSLATSIRSAWRNRPRLHPPSNKAVIFGGIGPIGAGISAYQSVESTPSDSLEDKIEALRKTAQMLRDDFEQNKRMTADALDSHRQEMNMETREQSTRLSGLAHKLKSVQTGGLAWSASGAVLVGVGIILTSMSIELHRWL